MNSEPVMLAVPAHIWAVVEQKFPWAKHQPQEAIVFLLGMAVGVWVDREHQLAKGQR